jgi:hypothetical protein
MLAKLQKVAPRQLSAAQARLKDRAAVSAAIEVVIGEISDDGPAEG